MCGAPNEDDAEFCGNCGAAMNADAVSSEEEASIDAMADIPQEAAPVQEALDQEAVEGDADEKHTVETPPAAPPPASPPTSNLAVASLVTGVAGLTLLPILGGILAIILGYMARREIREHPDEVSGDGLALAGIVMGWISVGLVVVGCLFFGAIVACGIFTAQTPGCC
jgi:hypothetical protein